MQWQQTYSLTDITSSKNMLWISRKNDKAIKIMIKTQILLWKTTEGNRKLRVRVRVRFLLFYFEFAPTDPRCNMLQTSDYQTFLPVFTLIYDSSSLFNKAITIHLAGDTELGLASKKLSTTESIINYELKNLRSNNLSLNSGKYELAIFRSKIKSEPDEITTKMSKSTKC